MERFERKESICDAMAVQCGRVMCEWWLACAQGSIAAPVRALKVGCLYHVSNGNARSGRHRVFQLGASNLLHSQPLDA